MDLDVNDIIAKLDPERRRRIEERAAELIAEEMTLRELRKARQLTQARVAAELGISQDGVSPPRTAQRFSPLDVAEDRGSHGRQPFAHRQVSRPPACRVVRNRRKRAPRLTEAACANG